MAESMSVYKESPNIVKVVITDDTGTAERFVVGRSLDEVIESVDPGANHEKHVKAYNEFASKKARKPRRTKVEMLAEKDLASQPEDVPPPHTKEKKEVWP